MLHVLLLHVCSVLHCTHSTRPSSMCATSRPAGGGTLNLYCVG